MVKYDLPTMINYTLKITGRRKLYYIGYSQVCVEVDLNTLETSHSDFRAR